MNIVSLKMLYTYLYMCQFSLKFPFYDSLKTVKFKWKEIYIYLKKTIAHFMCINTDKSFMWELLSLISNDIICKH